MDTEKLKNFIRSLPMAGLGWDFASGATREARWAAQKVGDRIRMEIETKNGEYHIDYIELTHEICEIGSIIAIRKKWTSDNH